MIDPRTGIDPWLGDPVPGVHFPLSGGSGFLSLNNEDHDAPPSGPVSYEDAAKRVYRPENIVEGPHWLTTRKDHLRNYLDQSLKEKYPSPWWGENYWDVYATYRKAAVDVFNIGLDVHGRNKYDGAYDVQNFLSCHWMHKDGFVVTDGNGDHYRQEANCGRPACWSCDSSSRTQVALENLEVWHAVYDNHPGGKGSLHIVFTLPDTVEDCHTWENAKDLKKALTAAIDRIIKTIFGRKTVKGTRSNIAFNLAMHPVGDNDIYRPRLHFHADIIPAEIIKHKDGTRELVWLQPESSMITGKHTPGRWKLDLAKIRDLWKSEAEAIFGRPFTTFANPQVKFNPYTPDGPGRERWQRKTAHTLKYNYRSFSKDMAKAAIRADYSQGLIVAKGKDKRLGVTYCRVFSALEYAQLYKWIRSENAVRGRGWLHNRNKYIKDGVLNVEREAAPEMPPETYKPVKAKIETEIRKVFKKGQFITEKSRKWHFYDQHRDGPAIIDQWGPEGEDFRPWLWPNVPANLL